MSTTYHNAKDYTASHTGRPFPYRPEPFPTYLLPNNTALPPSVYGYLSTPVQPTYDYQAQTNFNYQPDSNHFLSPRHKYNYQPAPAPRNIAEAPIDYVLTCNTAPGQKWNVITSQPFYKPGFIEQRDDYENINADMSCIENMDEGDCANYQENNMDYTNEPDTTTLDETTDKNYFDEEETEIDDDYGNDYRDQAYLTDNPILKNEIDSEIISQRETRKTYSCRKENNVSSTTSKRQQSIHSKTKTDKNGSTRNKRRIRSLNEESMSELG